jgi:3-oxoacyl-[acyl-carrier protein] reductase
MGTPEDVAAAVVFLASADSDYITGQIFNVDGGMTAQLRSPQVEGASVACPGDGEKIIPALLR